MSLVRVAPVRHALGTSVRRRARIRAIARWMAMGALVTLGIGVLERRQVMRSCTSTKAEIAHATVLKYAFEAYPSFLLENPDQTCPSRLRDLNEWMNNKGTFDPWGQHYLMHCDSTGIVVRSSGEDRILDTSDDLRSDR